MYCAWTIADILPIFSDFGEERSAFAQGFAGLVDFCRELGAEDVAKMLAQLPLPRSEQDEAGWRVLADGLWRVLEEERGFLPPRALSREEENQVNDYFYAVELLVRYLELAYVTDRQAILDNLLRPPGV